jgi:AcrR family transcriptional regulator
MVTSMTGSVKQPYASPLRAAQAQATRRAIVDAAAQLFIKRGYGATTMEAIAAQAGVSRKTVFTSVGGKAQALKVAIDWAITGDDEPVPLMERPEVQAQRQEPDVHRLLARYATMVREVNSRTAPLLAVLQAAAGLDENIRALADQLRAQRLTGMQALAAELNGRSALRKDLTPDMAADILWLLNDPTVYHRLVLEQHWPPHRYESWLTDTLVRLLIRDDYHVDHANR